VECVQYAGATDTTAVVDDDASVNDVMSEDEVSQLLQQLVSPDNHHSNLVTLSRCTASSSAAECDLIHKLRAASDNQSDDDDDDDDDKQRREFILNAQQFLASSLSPLDSCYRNMTVIRGQNHVQYRASVIALCRCSAGDRCNSVRH